MKHPHATLLICLASASPAIYAEDLATSPVKVLLLSGMNNHDWKATTPALERCLEEGGRFDVTVLEKTSSLSASVLAKYDAVVSNFNTFTDRRSPEKDAGWTGETRRALVNFVKRGKGHVTVHAGSSSFYDWPEYRHLTTGQFKVGQTSHGRQHEFAVKLRPHVITDGMTRFRTIDELWHGTDFHPDARVLATAFSSKESGGSGKDEPVAVAGRFGRGRSFFLVLGHNVRGIRSTGFRQLLRRGSEWAATGRVAPGKVGTLSWRRSRHSLALRVGDQTVWRFQHDPANGKSHFDRLAPVGWPNLVWVRPPDHVWHYGLWFSWKYLNSVNFWEENRETRRAAGWTTSVEVDVRPREDHSARIDSRIHYHLPDVSVKDAVLREARTIVVSPPRSDGSYSIDWSSVFTAGDEDVVFDRTPLPHEKGGKPYGGYAGLSLRMRSLAERRACSTVGPVEFSKQSRFRGRATGFDYSGECEGQTVGVAMLDHPGNREAPSPWYAIRSQVMTFFSPAVICFKPFKLAAGDSFKLRYRVVVHKGRWDSKRLREAHEEFAKEARSKP